jgi:DNA-dependent RNA polymerase
MTSLSRQKSIARFNRRNRLVTAKARPRLFLNTPYGQKLTRELFLEQLAEFLAGRRPEKPHKPPPFLRPLILQLDDYRFLALAALSPLLDAIYRGWDRNDPSVAAKLKLKLGDELYERMCLEKMVLLPWTEEQRLRAGDWLLSQALALDLFTTDTEDGFPAISPKWKPDVDRMREEMIWADPVHMPHLKPPPDWTRWWNQYDDRLRAKFVRDWRPETKAAITAAFDDPNWEHAKGVNALKKVPLQIDPTMLALVERFAVDVMGRTGDQRKADQFTVDADLCDAKWCGNRAVWLDYNCDRRGRLFAIQHLNFMREDHVRSLFKFANGMRLGPEGTYWLEVHCANCEGSTDKKRREERIKWVAENRQKIQNIGNNPLGTFDLWKDADSPFCYVAACIELTKAWCDPKNFTTHLPVGFDGSANGLQHLALLTRDHQAAAMVNLVHCTEEDDPRDVYSAVIAKAIELLKADDHGLARWWCTGLDLLGDKRTRRILKQPVMTYSYSVTLEGATQQISTAFRRLRQHSWPPNGGFRFLAEKVMEACELLLPGPAEVMKYVRALAQHCIDHGRFLEWTSPSGFPISNRYQVPNIVTFNLRRGSIRLRHNIADGATDEVKLPKALDSAAPNFIHSLDAAHLVRTVNASVSEGIADILTIHDSFYCLAPQATRFNEIILEELAALYEGDPLAELRSQNVSDPSNPDLFPVPPKGTLLLLDGKTISWKDGEAWRPELYPYEVHGAINAFG